MLAGIYARQSVEKADSVSIEAQIESCRAVCLLKRWDYKVYSDAGFSGGTLNRPAFESLLQDVHAGKVGAVVSYKLDRISRSIADFAGLLTVFQECSVEYVSATEQFDTSSPAGRAMIYMIMVFAQLERETITQRVTDNYKFRAAMGLYMGGGVPYGYKVRPIELAGKKAKALCLDTEAAETVRNIFLLYLSGYSTQKIAEHLSRENSPKTFSSASIARILRNPVYARATPDAYRYFLREGYQLDCKPEAFDGTYGVIGSLKTRKREKTPPEEQIVTVGFHEPLIEFSQWSAAQSKLNRSSPRTGRRLSARLFLAGLVECGECGAKFGLKSTVRNGRTYCYFLCRNKNSSCRNPLRVNAFELEETVWETLIRRAKQIAMLQPEPLLYRRDPRLEELARQKEETNREIESLVKNIGQGAALDRHLKQRIRELDGALNSLEEQIVDNRNHGHTGSLPRSSACIADSVGPALVSMPCEEKARLARALIRRIRVFPDAGVTVEFR